MSTTIDQSKQHNQEFWKYIAKLPEAAQKSFWEAGQALSAYIGENPKPHTLQLNTNSPPDSWPFWKKILFYLGQSQYNQSVANAQMGQSIAQGAGWLWGALQGDFNKSPTTGQVITGGVISLIPVVDQVCDVRDIIANCLTLEDPKERENYENWIALGLTCIGFIPELGSAVKTVGKVALKNANRLIDLLKQMEWIEKNYKSLKIAIAWGRAPIDWLRKYDFVAAMKIAADKAKAAFKNAKQKAEAAIEFAFGVVQAKLKQLVALFDMIIAKIGAVMADLGKRIRAKIDALLVKAKKEAGNYSATPGTKNTHVQGDVKPPEGARPKPKLPRMHTEPNTAFFWSGNTNKIGGQDVAAGIAKQRGGKTLEMIIEERGIKMPKWDADNPASVKAWQDISQEFAKGVSGEVRGVIGQNVRDKSIWLVKELPALKANPAVTKITTIDPVSLKELVIFTR